MDHNQRDCDAVVGVRVASHKHSKAKPRRPVDEVAAAPSEILLEAVVSYTAANFLPFLVLLPVVIIVLHPADIGIVFRSLYGFGQAMPIATVCACNIVTNVAVSDTQRSLWFKILFGFTFLMALMAGGLLIESASGLFQALHRHTPLIATGDRAGTQELETWVLLTYGALGGAAASAYRRLNERTRLIAEVEKFIAARP